jgi:hypothetical protein
VLFGLQKNFKDIESVFKNIYVFLFEKFFELLFFLPVNMFHINSLQKVTTQVERLKTVREKRILKPCLMQESDISAFPNFYFPISPLSFH